jgi:OOP family OmpA-OmpF porin
MTTKGGERVIDQPFERASVKAGSTAAPLIGWEDLTRLRAAYPALFDLMPPAAQRFELFFNAGGAVLTPASQQALGDVLAAVRARSGGDLVVLGFTDTMGTPQINDELSLRRALQIRQLLVQQGFPAERIEAVGRGMRELAVPTANGVDEPRNRRVTIVVR